MNCLSQIHTFKVEPDFLNSLPLNKLYKWAVEHHVERDLLHMLNDELFRWNYREMTVGVFFCSSEESLRFMHEGGIVEGSVGDVFFFSSVTDKHAGYRKDVVSYFQWAMTENRWLGKTQSSFYYGKASPFGGYTKPMPCEWGVKKLFPD
jgi:hypothetical protein